MKISFFGGVEQVTGSKYFVEDGDTKILVDCGLFQGDKETRKRNWNGLPIEASSIDAVVLTHAHIDHTGYIPALVKKGFRGKIYCSKGTYDLCAIMLLDSGFLQEKHAEEINEASEKKKISDHSPALPLYTVADAESSLTFFHVVDFNKEVKLGTSLHFTLIPSGHILGSSFVIVSDGKETLTFSGDLGRPNQLTMKAPTHLKKTDYLVIESTYGNRLHEQTDPIQELGEVVNQTVAKGGVLIIPSFAVGRAQTILYCLYQLKQQKLIPDIPIFLDSPMAINVTNLFCKFKDEHILPTNECTNIFDVATYTRTVEESKHIDQLKGSSIIIAGAGMANGGRVLHHFKHFISHAKNTILFVGFQAAGTNGRDLIEGAKKIDIYGKEFKVRAQIKKMNGLSAHADYQEILEWLGHFETTPKKVFITHGELDAAQALQKKIEERFGWDAVIPKYLESFDLD